MMGLMAVRRRLQRQPHGGDRSNNSDHETERVGSSRRKRRRRECQHEPWVQELAQGLSGAYNWLVEPTNIKSEHGNGLENTSWSRLCSNESSILIGMMMFRFLNYLMVQTYYVPDEYWQSLEIAHHQVFHDGYITWEWTAKIRSYLYPAVFTFLYKIMDLIHLDTYLFLTKLPRIIQGLSYAVGDLYLYKLSSKLAGPLVGQWTLLCNCLSWFIFYCSTRTLTNTTETTLIIIALYYFPWSKAELRASDSWKFLWLAALSILVRPTAAVIWIPLCFCHIWFMRRQFWKVLILYCITAFVFVFIMMRIDKAFYGEWTFVPANFFYFNITKKISHIYGTHPWYWYFIQCVPFVLSTHTVLLVLGWKRCKNRSVQILFLWTVALYSLFAHKEFRFILPVLPICMHVCGYYITTLHQQVVVKQNDDRQQLEVITEEQVTKHLSELKSKREANKPRDQDSGLTASEMSDSMSDSEIINAVRKKLNKINKKPSQPFLTPRRAVLLLLVGNIPMMLYFSLIHQRGAVEVTQFLHSESLVKSNMSVLFLMPCHSTPYYSHIHTNITMRFLTCEPNLDGAVNYTDEADRFYTDPIKWLKKEVVKGPNKHIYSHVVMFDSLELKVEKFLSKGKYTPCAQFFYSHITDERRSKNIKVYCR